jgi:hypothetical protein
MNDVIAIIGRAPCWAMDFFSLQSFISKDKMDIMVIGKDCEYAGHIDFFATYHPADIPVYKAKRKLAGQNTDYKIVCHVNEKDKPVDLLFRYEHPSGSSALLGTQAAIYSGYKKIVLCGCPLEGVNEQNYSYTSFQKGWVKHKAELEDKVRSMSGWTAKFLGKCDEEWIKI